MSFNVHLCCYTLKNVKKKNILMTSEKVFFGTFRTIPAWDDVNRQSDSLCRFNSSIPLNCFLNATAIPAPIRRSWLMQWAKDSSSGQEKRSPGTCFSLHASSSVWPQGGSIALCEESEQEKRNENSKKKKKKNTHVNKRKHVAIYSKQSLPPGLILLILKTSGAHLFWVDDCHTLHTNTH